MSQKLFIEGKLIGSDKSSFLDKTTNVETIRYKNYIQVNDPDEGKTIMIFNSKFDCSKVMDKNAIFTIAPYPMKGSSGFWLSITGCKEISD